MATPVNQRVQKHREAMRAAGLKQVQLWVVDTRTPEFQAEARRQSRLVSAANIADREDRDFLNAALDELLEELEKDELLIATPGDHK